LSVTRASTAGGADIKISGTNLWGDEAVMFGDVAATGRPGSNRSGTTLFVVAPQHAAGVVEVVVTTPAGPLRVPHGLEFVDQKALDFNGKWGGYLWDGSDVWVEFVIRNNSLVSLSCTFTATTTIEVSADVVDGSFSAQGADDFRMSGRILSPSQASGTLAGKACLHTASDPWKVDRIE
jgi:hypothetical protein